MIQIRLSFLLCLLLSAAAQADLYKWVGPDGKVTYSDMPPPKSATNVETKSMSGLTKSSELPYELAQAVKNMPVTLYSGDKCAPCLDGRNFLKKQGIPFTEKTVTSREDIDKLTQISGSTQIPILFIGRNKLAGFSSGEWRTNLTQAGYPESNQLPANYHFAEPQPLAPVGLSSKSIEIHESKPQPAPSVPARDPNGFHF
jgi:glutaredoxin